MLTKYCPGNLSTVRSSKGLDGMRRWPKSDSISGRTPLVMLSHSPAAGLSRQSVSDRRSAGHSPSNHTATPFLHGAMGLVNFKTSHYTNALSLTHHHLISCATPQLWNHEMVRFWTVIVNHKRRSKFRSISMNIDATETKFNFLESAPIMWSVRGLRS